MYLFCRLNGQDMLRLLRDKRLVFVGDSLNRNMWESLVCVLRNSLEDMSGIFEASGRHEYRTEGSYSFIFKVSCPNPVALVSTLQLALGKRKS